MRRRREIEQELAKYRGQLWEVLGGEPTDETRAAGAAASQALAKLEAELVDAIQSEADEERAAPGPLLRRAALGEYLQSGVSEKALTGAEAELNAELGLDDRGVLPWAALLAEEDRAEMEATWETRQDVATTVAAAAISRQNQEVLRRVFARTAASWVGVRMPAAPRGLPNYPVMTAGVTGSAQSVAGSLEAEAATFTGQTIDLTRIGTRYRISVEDMARFAPLEEVLRSDMRQALGILLDQQIINGDGNAPNVKGIFREPVAVADPGAVADLAFFDSEFAGRVDGLYAFTTADVRCLVDVPVYDFMRKTRMTIAAGQTGATAYADKQEGDTLWNRARADTGGFLVSTHGPKAAANVSKCLVIVPNGLRAYAPVWQGMEMIRDPYSRAAEGQIDLTLFMLFGFGVTRKVGLTEFRVKTA